MNNFDFNNTREEKKKRTFLDYNNVREDSGKENHKQSSQDKSHKTMSNNSTNSIEYERIDIDRLNKEFNKSKQTVKNRRYHQRKKKRRNNILYYIALGVFLLVIIFASFIITDFISKQHQSHISRINNSLNTGEVKNAVDYFNKRISKDDRCKQEALSLYLSYATQKFLDYIDQNATYEQTEEAFKILGEIADDNTSLEIQKLWEKIVQIKSTADMEEENLAVESEQVESETSSDTEENNQILGTVFLEDCTILESASYQGNEGDSFVYPIGQHQFTRGQCDISGKTYYHGIEAWIARWNYEDEISWAYSIFALPTGYKTLTGSVVLIDSYNTKNFDATLYFTDADTDKEIKSFHLTPKEIPFDFNVPVNGTSKLKIYVKDNKAVSGGTSFGLVNTFLNSEVIY